MDTIWNCAFGVDIDLQNKHDNEYFLNAEKFFREVVEFDLRSLAKICGCKENFNFDNYNFAFSLYLIIYHFSKCTFMR